MKQKLFFLIILAIATLLISVIDTYAVGSLYVRPRWSETDYQKVWIKTVLTDVNINEQIAVTHIDQTFFNELNESVEAIYIFPLPENAVITEMVYWVNGIRYVAEIRERQDAVNAYNEKLRQWLDPALLEDLGDNLFRLSIVPIDPLSEIHTEVTYVEPLKYEFGEIEYNYKLNTMGLSSQPLESVVLDINVESQNNIKSFYSPTHNNPASTNISNISENQYRLFYGDENFIPDSDFTLKFETIRDDVDFKILTYSPTEEDSIGNDDYFALWITPPDDLDQNEIIAKNIVFTADISSSMEGERILQLKETINSFLDLLNPIDKFNIITFGTFANSFSSDLVEANETNIAEAKNYVTKLSALGLTNIDEALTESLGQSFEQNTSNNLIFITDGRPTWGETNPASIVEKSINNNLNDVKIYSFGIGEDLSRQLLTDISLNNHGFSTFITSNDSISSVVTKHFVRISKPVLTDIELDLDPLVYWDTYPQKIPDLHWGTQVLYLGRYINGGEYNVSLEGKVNGETHNYNKTINFADNSTSNRFVPRLWAKTKIDHILLLIETYGETDELINQVIELGLTYQILTPYTAFYVDPTTDVKEDETLPTEFVLKQNYPNPFNPETTIEYTLSDKLSNYHVVIKVYDVLGQLVALLVDSKQSPGNYKTIWNGNNMNGEAMPSGIYFYTMEAGNSKQVKKMILLR